MLKRLLLFSFLIILATGVRAQLMNYYWGHSFNSTSSLLGGAVIAGEADNTAIYYNPATINEMQQGSNLSLAANLFTWNIYNFEDALGDGIDLYTDNFLVQPQFMSYSYTPHRKGLSLSVAVLTRVKEQMEMTYINSSYKDVLTNFPGDEKYSTTFNYRNDFSDTWVGGALSHEVSSQFSYGLSLFVSGATLNYRFNYSATAFHYGDTIAGGIPMTWIAEGSYSELVKFTDYRLILKLGFAYKTEKWRFGFTMTSPTWRVYSSGKRAQRIARQTNIQRNNMPPVYSDYLIFDGQEKNQLTTDFRIPFSTGFGFIYDLKKRGQKLFFSAEFFAGLRGYKMVDAQINPDITSQNIYDTLTNKDWTSYTYAANPVLNVAVGYSWTLSNDLIFMNAIRTDFSAVNNANLEDFKDYNYIKTTKYNIYHYSGGVEFTLKKNRFIAGADLAFGYQTNLPQIANFSSPVEYDKSSGRALQGPLKNEMDVFYFGFNIYLGATLNFSKKKPDKEK
ncbi:MAG: hypothetical protein GXO86_10430 [Chlorobi bacterium]|nr:hypothetical protein [Chlorobiota bacterium]